MNDDKKFRYVLQIYICFSFSFYLIKNPRKAMALQRLLDQGCVKRETFDIKKLLVSKNGSRKKVMHLIRNISRLPPVE